MAADNRTPSRDHQPRVQRRLRHRHRVGDDSARSLRGRRPADLREEGRARVAPRVAAEGLPPLAHDEGADLAERPLPADRLPVDRVLLGARRTKKDGPKSLEDVDPKLLETYEKLGIPLRERGKLAGVAVDAVFDSVSVATTFREQLSKVGVIFCSFSEAVQNHPELVRKYLGSVVPYSRQLLRDAELRGLLRRLVLLHPEGRPLPDGAVDVLPDQLREHGPVRAHADHRGRGRVRLLPRGLHRSDPRREPAPRRRRRARRARRRADQVLDGAELVSRATRTARAASTTSSRSAASARGARSKISWTQVETGSAITWKYPSCILLGDDSVGEFYSVAVVNNCSRRTPARR